MSIPAYTKGYPPDGSSLGQTKVVIRDNLDGTFETLNVDHVNNNGQPGSQPAGYHTIIHEVSQANVSTVANYNQVFSGVPGTLTITNGMSTVTTPAIPPSGDTQLYSLSGAGVLSQLTGFSATTNGYAWVGGILLQWGVVTSPPNSGSVTFPVAFPTNAPFFIDITLDSSFVQNTTPVINSGVAPTKTAFSYLVPGALPKFYWFAIGN
jgi:hypothetical protein